ncbi:radical sam [Lucifera butyrica]|uniref:Threonylcarbamoyladenosine tRNA methylthiotransferase MtaB n=1 Tax=Lucifera butyrica TaxID=1351585 RepID=A0A498R3V9_9FIRM|nr:tRNA (N(6)-L-threonylcarbamoyladenosine(37)-C(2))-methylthiotransferase MtaB [Lucifera butyrica]VBB06094.1 radical sam [Lucifera butyrica]
MPKVAFLTLGCKVNQYETEIMEGLFKQYGYQTADFTECADVYVINTCSVTHLGERKSRQAIRRAVRSNPAAVIAVTGCYAQISAEQIAAIPDVDVIIGTRERQKIVQLVEEARRSSHRINAVQDIMQADTFEDIPLFDTPGKTRAFLKIQDGCTNFCTYCIIPYARGPLRSRPLASIIREAEKLAEAGFQEIVLTGIHLGAYGRDLDGQLTLAEAVKAVLRVDGLARLRLGSLESVEVPAEIIDIMQQDPRLCPHLHLPLQAGDNRILKAMNRHYSTEEYRRLVAGLQERVPDLAVSTDIIVGFPGETDEMFNNALAFIDNMNFSRMHIFPYSRRTGTPAAEYPLQVPEEVKKKRGRQMQDLARKKKAEFTQPFIGRTMEVLFETQVNGVIDGLTRNYLRVYAANHNTVQPGMIRNVQLEKPYQDGLWGNIS